MQMLYKTRLPQMGEKGDNEESLIQRLYKARLPQRDEKGDNKESGYRSYTNPGCRKLKRKPIMKRMDTRKLYKSRVPQREDKGYNEESGYRGYTN